MSSLYHKESLIQTFQRVKHFQSLTENQCAAIVNAGQIRIFPAGTIIYRDGEEGAGMFVLLEGHVHLTKLGPQGQQIILAEINPVIMFNEVTVLDGGVNPTTAIAMQECLTWQIGYAEFQSLLQTWPTIGIALLPLLARRLRMFIAQCEDLSFRSTLARTAKLLLNLSARGTQPIVRREYSNEVLAAHIGTVPEVVSRSLQVLHKRGMITCQRSAILVQQPELLERVAQGDGRVFELDQMPDDSKTPKQVPQVEREKFRGSR